ncbi:MAG: hypothetical protein ACLFVO_18655 [Chloroflexaceae bacterium]
MLGIIEIILFVCGMWGLIMGKLPSIVFGKNYRIEGAGARVIGAILVLPLLLALGVGFILGLFLVENAIIFASIFELVTLIICFAVAFLISRRVRQPVVA